MRVASRIILLIGMITSFVEAGIYLIAGTVLLIFGSPAQNDLILQGIEDGTIHTGFNGTPEEQARFIQITLIILGVVFLVIMVLNLINAYIANRGRKQETTGWYIANIVFGLISACEVNAIGAIFGLIAEGIEKNKPNVVE